MKSLSIPMLLFLCPLLTGACTPLRPMPPLASVEGVPGHFSQGRIIDLSQGKAISFDEFVGALGGRDVIFVGEVHDNPEHHLIEVQILQALSLRYGPLDIAMEFFATGQQAALDRYLKEDIPEDVFLKEGDWRGGWGFPYHLFRPLLFSAKAEGNYVYGINLPHRVARKVARSGLQGLTPEERSQAAEEIDLTHEAHRAYLKRVFEEHSHPDLGNFDYFYQAQCLWEDTMAENIARRYSHTGRKTVALVGNGHIIHRFGIPERLARRTPVNMATVLLYPLTERLNLTKTMADYVWLTAGCSAGGHGRRVPVK